MFTGRDARSALQVRDKMLVLGQVPLAVGDPVAAAVAVPALSLSRIRAHESPRPLTHHPWHFAQIHVATTNAEPSRSGHLAQAGNPSVTFPIEVRKCTKSLLLYARS